MIRWLMQTDADLPALPPAAWLSPPERERLAALHIPKRRQEWLLGRWTAKRLIQAYAVELGLPEPELYALSIVPCASGAPELTVAEGAVGRALEGVCVSISHSAGVAFCAITPSCEERVGADVERIEPRHPAFAGDYFTPAELHLIAAAPAGRRDTLITATWSAKEAALKALCLGLTVDTRRVECLLGPATDDWSPFAINLAPSLPGLRPLRGLWRERGGFVLTLATPA